MKINIKATGIELTTSVSDYVTKKISSLEKYVAESADVVAQVEVGKSTNHHKSGDIFKAEVHIIGGGLDLYAVSEQADLYAAIDLVKDDMAQKLSHIKGKKEALHRRGARMMKDVMRGLNPFKKRNE